MTAPRLRRSEDIDECVAALHAVHLRDGYPVRWPTDPARWLSPLGLRAAWVALDAEGVAGHVLLRDDRRGDAGALEVGRLFVRPSARRQGLAVRLLDVCRDEAASLDRDLVLETVDGSAAIHLYESTGWRRTETTTADWVDAAGAPVMLHRYRMSR